MAEKDYKDYEICVWDLSFSLRDEDGEEVKNKDGSLKLFDAPNLDCSWIIEGMEYKDLEEREGGNG
tara:strand:- start:144 stop:341 length:198 start_codon:yes stop_codon:yes gene_type:complete